MNGRRGEDDYFVCPHCGADVPAQADFCRECGASDESGWNDSDELSDRGGYAPDDDFDYDDYLRREFPEHAETADGPRRWLLRLVVAIVCLAFLVWLLVG